MVMVAFIITNTNRKIEKIKDGFCRHDLRQVLENYSMDYKNGFVAIRTEDIFTVKTMIGIFPTLIGIQEGYFTSSTTK